MGVLGHFAQTGGASSIQYRWVDNIDRIIMIIRNTLKLTRVDNPTFLFFCTSLILHIFILILTRVGGPTFLICNVSLVLYFLFPEILQTLSVDTNLIIGSIFYFLGHPDNSPCLCLVIGAVRALDFLACEAVVGLTGVWVPGLPSRLTTADLTLLSAVTLSGCLGGCFTGDRGFMSLAYNFLSW